MGFLNSKTGNSANGAAPIANGADDPSEIERSAGAENELEKVRELLFGVQISRVRQDMDRFEHRLADQSGELREQVSRRLESFERSIQRRLDKVEQRLGQEANQRLEAYNQLLAKLDSQKELVESGLAELGKRVEEGNADLTSQLHGQGKLFSESIRRNCEELSAHFEREAEAAAKARADRSGVAKILLELGKQLEGGEPDQD